GKRLICDALEAGANPQLVFFSRVEKLSELPVDKLRRATLVKVKFEDIKIWSDLVAPQGVIAIFSRPDPERLIFPQARHTVLRAAMGAHFRLPIYTNLDWKDVESRLPDAVRVHVADNYWSGRVADDDDDGKKEHHAEGNKAPSKPMKAGDYGWVSTTRGPRRNADYDSDGYSDSDSDDETPGRLSMPRVDAQLYHERWARQQEPAALVIGGETRGLSLESVELAGKTAGRRLRISMVAGVDSLNAAMAASIILFEGRRQMLDSSEEEASGRKGTMAMDKMERT
ncbi:hypothetical protein CRUP_027403, partial [Coryphaenoides rupestris]